MNNESYDEYIRSILGYPMQQNNCNTYNQNEMYQYETNNNKELEECYPEIYKIVYPMVCKACINNTRPVTKELIDSLTNEIYMAIEGNEEVNVNINLNNNVRSSETQNSNTNPNMYKKPEVKVENRSQESRQIRRNFLLNDLIRILLIRELLGGGNQRPPFRPPLRPGFPGGIGPRPPIMPRDIQNDFDMYEY